MPYGETGAPEETVTERTVTRARAPVCLFAHAGQIEVELPGRPDAVLTPERGLWLPRGTSFRLRETGRGVVLPVAQRVPLESALLSRVREIAVPSSSKPRVLAAFQGSLGHFDESKHACGELARSLIARHEPALALLDAATPPLPRMPVARELARETAEQPWRHDELGSWAAARGVSERTLQRRFLDETGRTFARWRGDARIAAAVRIMIAEGSAAEAAARVGFANRSSLSRACRARLGLAPRQIVALAANAPSASDVLTLPPPSATGAPWSSGPRRNGISGLVWLARGDARLEVGGEPRVLREGDTAWLPAGRTVSIDLGADSVLLPYLWVGGAEPPGDELRRLRRSDERQRLRTIAERYAWPRIVGPLPATAWGWSTPRQRTELAPADKAALEVRERVTRRPSDRRSLAEWAQWHGVPAEELRAAFRRATGLTFPRWRTSMRMVVARRLLREGVAVDEAAARLGYAHAANFTRAFTAAHGVPPTAYRADGSDASRALP